MSEPPPLGVRPRNGHKIFGRADTGFGVMPRKIVYPQLLTARALAREEQQFSIYKVTTIA